MEGDDRYVPVVTPLNKGGQTPDLQSLNDTFRAIFMNLYKVEGRTGESQIRDDLLVMGKITFLAKTTTPELSGEDEAVIYLDDDGVVWMSSNGGAYAPIVQDLMDITGVGETAELGFESGDMSTTGDATSVEIALTDVPERVNYSEDFITVPWNTSVSGTGGAVSLGTSPGRIGIMGGQTGATINSTVRFHPRSSATNLSLTFGDVPEVKIGLGSSASTNRRIIAGCGTDVSSATFGTDSIYFMYDSSVGANWLCRTRAGGVETNTDSGVAFTVDHTTRLYYILNSGVDVKFYIDEVLVATHTTDIPADSTGMGPGTRLQNLTGANASYFLDYVRLYNPTPTRV